MSMIVRCVDVESTSLNADAKVVELGWCDVDAEPGRIVGKPRSVLVNPGIPIPPEASAVHHITDEMVRGAPDFDRAMLQILTENGWDYICAHVAKFESQFIKPSETVWLCTYKIALAIAPNAPAHNLQTLRYWAKLNLDAGLASPPHRAGPDAYVCAALLARMLGKMPVEQMLEISSKPAMLPRFTFGKHAMVPIAEVPADYLRWMLDKGSFDDEDVLHTARCELARRRAANGQRTP